MTIIKVITMSI